MEFSDIEKKLILIMREVFDRGDLTISRGMAPSDIPQWDSLNNIRLIVAIEAELGINFEVNELANFDSIDQLINTIKLKLK